MPSGFAAARRAIEKLKEQPVIEDGPSWRCVAHGCRWPASVAKHCSFHAEARPDKMQAVTEALNVTHHAMAHAVLAIRTHLVNETPYSPIEEAYKVGRVIAYTGFDPKRGHGLRGWAHFATIELAARVRRTVGQ